jgi:hypothetical protein
MRRRLAEPGAVVHQAEVFLIGGGRGEEALADAHAGLAAALEGGVLLCLVADDGEGIDEGRWRGMLGDAGVVDCELVRIAEDRVPTTRSRSRPDSGWSRSP